MIRPNTQIGSSEGFTSVSQKDVYRNRISILISPKRKPIQGTKHTFYKFLWLFITEKKWRL